MDLTNSDIAYLTKYFDNSLNSLILCSLLFGIYTGIFAVTMRNIYSSKSQHIGQAMIVVIILIYIATSVNSILSWPLISSRFTFHGQNIWTRYLWATRDDNTLNSVGLGTTGIICNILTDSAMIWRCWIVWGKHYLIIAPPSLCLVSGIDGNASASGALNLILYASFTLATTLWCTFLIIYRILSVGWTNSGARGRFRAYRHIIEVLVESSALYSICLILYMACSASNGDWGIDYLDILAAIARGVAPTILVGRVAAGHAHPDDSSDGSIVSSLHFGQGQSQTSTQQDSMFSINLNDDPEAQVEQTDEPEHAQTSSHGVYSDDAEAQWEEVEISHKATGQKS
ncbi:hypothetical protein DFS33DRAFT_1451888 [Desarmillaria ectypa]|nr:hypothetical protein DFS33DRAFT_1451888 [Desarmillaria ectypa]